MSRGSYLPTWHSQLFHVQFICVNLDTVPALKRSLLFNSHPCGCGSLSWHGLRSGTCAHMDVKWVVDDTMMEVCSISLISEPVLSMKGSAIGSGPPVTPPHLPSAPFWSSSVKKNTWYFQVWGRGRRHFPCDAAGACQLVTRVPSTVTWVKEVMIRSLHRVSSPHP